ncbi:hypothetical protein OESDEN_06483 [Oesophagostomum dentatum]|uniref:Uncharacterized protein n=1 Tax=Oesophagostomum dentatum TaxID=61180 RepID=A0A0B1TE15_OESDE|nr:hypothetical protein OESDEN_06483 [Oesophagostomum dentatum]
MSQLILYLALVVFVYAVPPTAPQQPQIVKARKPKIDIRKLVPLKLEPVEPDELVGAEHNNQDLASYPCEDGKNNIINVGNAEAGLRIQIRNVEVQTYTGDGKPSCYKGRARVAIPGLVKAVNGTVLVKAPSDLKKSAELKLTLKKDSALVGTVCEDGKRKKNVIPDGICTQKLNKEFPEKIYEMLGIPGTYDIAQIAEAAGFALIFPIESMKSALKIVAKMIRLLYMKMTIELESLNGALKFGVDGEWKAALSLFSEGQEVAALKFPSNTEWVHVD